MHNADAVGVTTRINDVHIHIVVVVARARREIYPVGIRDSVTIDADVAVFIYTVRSDDKVAIEGARRVARRNSSMHIHQESRFQEQNSRSIDPYSHTESVPSRRNL